MAFVNDGHVKRAARLRAEARTPGPWHLVNVCEVHDKATQFDESGARIGDTPNLICRVEYPYGCDEGKNANASLIAAAPDMLDALLHLMRYDFGDSEGAKLARAAIAKATGVQL